MIAKNTDTNESEASLWTGTLAVEEQQAPSVGVVDLAGPVATVQEESGGPVKRSVPGTLLGRGAWTIAGYGTSIVVRFASNIVLARLLTPQIFGVMVVVNSLRMGVELLTDVGVEQNIVHNEKGFEDEFFNTAWTLQIIRGLLLTLLFLCFSAPLSHFYSIDRKVFLAASFLPLANALHSTSLFGLVKAFDVKQRMLFEGGAEVFGFFTCLGFALVTPTVWALIAGALLGTAARSLASYWLPRPRHRLVLNRACVREIVHFGKWIFLSSFFFYCSGNVDRLALGKLAPLAVLGIYGMARTIAEIPATMASRLGYQTIFPFLAAQTDGRSEQTCADLASVRLKLCLCGALLLACAIAWADLMVRVIYDVRYLQVGWVLSLLLFGTWVAILSNLNEAVLLGCGRPVYSTVANGLRLAAVAACLPVCYWRYGLAGVVAVMVGAELIRYLGLAAGQYRVRWSFFKQDALCTAVLFAGVVLWLLLRRGTGMGMPWGLAAAAARQGTI